MKHVARQFERDVWRKGKALDKEGKRIEEHAGTETIREGVCEQHGGASTQFQGVNEHGWIFSCSGRGAGAKQDGVPHYYTNRAPEAR